MMKFKHKKKNHTQEVDPREGTRIALLKRNGWRQVEESPEPKRDDGNLIPADFPGAEALQAAGYETLTDLETVEDFTEIEGIGKATATKIEAALLGGLWDAGSN